MNILILNWRDIKNPSSGGAEILTHEIAKRWVKLGNQVTQFSSCFPNCLAEEKVDGVKIIRRGHPDARFLFSSVHFLAFKFYRNNVQKFDVVVDEIHGLPFFTPWYVREKKVVLICEVAGDLWVKMFGPFFGLLGRVIERIYLQFVYKDIPYLTISNSTKEELIKEGVNGKDITVLPMGITFPKSLKKYEKEKNPTLIFVGRLSKSKGIEDAIEALRQVSKTYVKTKLWIVGNGADKKYESYLRKMAKKLDVSDRIIFWRYVSQEKKFELMGKAHILVVPSSKEGWGLIVPEAGFMGTPAVGYNVPGIREVIQDEKTGYLTSNNNPDELIRNIKKILKDKDIYEKMSRAAKKLSLSYNWNNTAEIALKVIKESL